MKTLVLHGNRGIVLLDDDWYAKLARYRWHLTCKGYAGRSPKPGKTIFMHRVINRTPDGLQTDHINGNKLDNQSANLRSVSAGQNSRARRRLNKRSVTGFRGVQRLSQGRVKFQAAITKDYTYHYLGVFTSAEVAARAYDKAARQLFGEFAELNFADE